MTHATGKTSAKNKCFWIKMLRNIPKRVRKVLIRFNELGVHVSHRAAFITQEYGYGARILLFYVFSQPTRKIWQKRRKTNVLEKQGLEKKKKIASSERPRCALCCPFSNLPVPFLVRKLLHLFSKVYISEAKNLKN